MTLLFLLLACNPKPPPAVPPALPPLEAPAAPPTPAERRVLTLTPEELRWDEAAGTVTFSPGSAVQSAHYEHFVLDIAALEAALGARPAGPVAVEVALLEQHTRTEVPADPLAPAPMGGFQITTWKTQIVGPAPDSSGQHPAAP